MTTHELSVGDGNLRWYDAGPADASITVMWHHGTPNIGEPPAPLLDAAAERGIRWLGFDRSGYGDSTAVDGRRVADVASLAARVADAAGVGSFVAVGHSGGGPHALACGALLGDRVSAVVSIAGLAPFGASGLDYFAGMHGGGAAELRAALDGASRLETLLAATEFDPEMFTPADLEELEGDWAWLNAIAAAGVARGLDGMTAD
ncbi:MAG: alpha/beta hydrolase, partial [Demequinaceae bacterium]|nr:alpha/beta hydrolase [Demequinaceae bacterium]